MRPSVLGRESSNYVRQLMIAKTRLVPKSSDTKVMTIPVPTTKAINLRAIMGQIPFYLLALLYDCSFSARFRRTEK